MQMLRCGHRRRRRRKRAVEAPRWPAGVGDRAAVQIARCRWCRACGNRMRVEPQHEQRAALAPAHAPQTRRRSGPDRMIAAEKDRHSVLARRVSGRRNGGCPGRYLGQGLQRQVAMHDGPCRKCLDGAHILDSVAEAGQHLRKPGGSQGTRPHFASHSASAVLHRCPDDFATHCFSQCPSSNYRERITASWRY